MALQFRQKHGVQMMHPAPVYDLCEKENVEVRFTDIPSFEGLYCNAAIPTILVSALRPTGRRHFTCAHELGHHLFGHGEQIDVLVETNMHPNAANPDEFTADRFAATLLMP